MLAEHVRIAVTQLFEQAGRALDVGEEKRNRPAGKLGHASSLVL
jgi:hypothetical protein